ncbi:hypothetical protein [Longibacter sp.]|uniref:hypothetical protein n=1 Tax=Longibacter sp. TaxID=2045415 RepID=UPI003EBAD70D
MALGPTAQANAHRLPTSTTAIGCAFASAFGVAEFGKIRREDLQRIRLVIGAEIRLKEVELAGGLPQDLPHGRGLRFREAAGQA